MRLWYSRHNNKYYVYSDDWEEVYWLSEEDFKDKNWFVELGAYNKIFYRWEKFNQAFITEKKVNLKDIEEY